MKKQIIILLTLLGASLTSSAQKEYRLAKATGHLILNLNGVIVEGYDGREILFLSNSTAVAEVDKRAKGLVPIASSGLSDNTGMGINVKENGPEVSVNNVFNNNSEILTIKVPQGFKVSFANNNNKYYEDVIIKNIKGEIEVSAYYNKIRLENNAGPMNINSIKGSVDAIFSGLLKGPISIISIYDYVDITLPVALKGNIELATNYGKIYAAREFQIDIDKTPLEKNVASQAAKGAGRTTGTFQGATDAQNNANAVKTASTLNNGITANAGFGFNVGEKIKGRLNGGGIDLIFKSINNNVYLRNR